MLHVNETNAKICRNHEGIFGEGGGRIYLGWFVITHLDEIMDLAPFREAGRSFNSTVTPREGFLLSWQELDLRP